MNNKFDIQIEYQKVLQLYKNNHFKESLSKIKFLYKYFPQNIEIINTYSVILIKCEQKEKAEALLGKALINKNFNELILSNYSNLLMEKGNLIKAEKYFLMGKKLFPENENFKFGLGLIETHKKNYHEGIKIYDDLLNTSPQNISYLNNRGELNLKLCIFDKAKEDFEKAISINPSSLDPLLNLGACYYQSNNFSKAIRIFEDINSKIPNNHKILKNLGISYLSYGDYSNGFKILYKETVHFEDNYKNSKQKYNLIEWDGSKLDKDHNLLVVYEQGFGDILQFLRFIILAKERSSKILLQIPYPLEDIVESNLDLKGIEINPKRIKAKYITSLMMLPKIFNINLKNIPKPFKIKKFKNIDKYIEQISEIKHTKIGIAWCGNPDHVNDHNRSCPLIELSSILKLDYDFFTLQKDINEDDLRYLKSYTNVNILNKSIKTFSSTAHILSKLDLVITVDTSIAHLSGCMNKTTILILPYRCDWRWEHHDKHMWYDNMKIVKQDKPNNWAFICSEISKSIENLRLNNKQI